MSILSLAKAGILLDLYFFKNNRAQLISFVAWPYLILALLLGLGLVLGSEESFRRNVGNMDPLVFFVASSLVVSASLNVIWGVGGQVLHHRWVGTLPYLLMSPHRTTVILLFTYLPRYFFWSFLQLLLYLPLLVFAEGLLEALGDSAFMALAIAIGVLPMLGISGLIAAFFLTIREESNVLGWLNPLILLISGAFYPAYLFPVWAQAVSNLIPTTHALTLARFAAALGGTSVSHLLFVMGILLGLAVFYNAGSIPVLGRAERAALRRGNV